MEQKARRKRVLLTLDTKLRIIDRLEGGESFLKLAEEYNIGKTTIREIFSKKQDYLNFARNSDSYNSVFKRKTLKKSMNHELDTAVFQWFQQRRAEGQPMTKGMLIENAQRIHKQLGMTEPFAASDGWLKGFKGRHGIVHLDVPGKKFEDIAPHLLNDNTNESYESYEADFEKVTVEEDNKEATMQQIYRLQESTKASKKQSDPLVRPEENYETPSCSTTEAHNLVSVQRLDNQFGTGRGNPKAFNEFKAPHLLNENTNESFESYEADFEKVTVEEDSKEATLQQIYRLQEAMQASKKLKADCTEPSDPLVRPEEQDNNENSYETPSCSTTEVNKLDFDAQKLDQIDQFGALITYEMQSLKSKKVLRQLKMNILKLVYEAQDEDESANDN